MDSNCFFVEERKNIIVFAEKNYNMLKLAADNASIVKYGNECEGIGCLFPKIYKSVCKGKYGRFINTIGLLNSYTIYEFDHYNRPLRIRKIDNNKCYETIYFLEYNMSLYAITFFGDSNRYFKSTVIYKFIVNNEILLSFSFFSTYRLDEFEFFYDNYPHITMIESDSYLSDNMELSTKRYFFEYDIGNRGRICNLKRLS